MLHALPGRIRAKDTRFYDRALSQAVAVYCEGLTGVSQCRINPRCATILIVFDPEKADVERLFKNIDSAIDARHNLALMPPDDSYLKAVAKKNKAKKWLLIYSMIYLAFKVKQGLYGKFSISRNIHVLEVASVVTIVGGYPLLKGFYRKFTKHVPTDSDLLLKLTALSMTIVRESAKGVLVLWLKSLSDYIRYSSDVECLRVLRQNMNSTAQMAYLLQDNNRVLLPIGALNAGDIIMVNAGETIGVNGYITAGQAVVNSRYHTGQPLTYHAETGDAVFEGMSVLSGTLEICVTHLSSSSEKPNLPDTAMGVYQHVEQYTHNITFFALGLSAIHYLLYHSTLGALAVMLVLCPSASGTAFSSGLKNYVYLLNKNRMHIRNPNVLEKLAQVNHVVFDKTGTLTQGIMAIQNIVLFDPSQSKTELLKCCAACEVEHYHPISVTLQKAGQDYDISKVKSSVLLPSKGISAQYQNQRILIGNKALMQENHIDISVGEALYDASQAALRTPVFVACGQTLTALIALEDVVRSQAPLLIENLKAIGIQKISLVTGDSAQNAHHLAASLGIPQVYSDCSAQDKENLVNSFKQQGVVMMVGDGVNDIFCMRAADVSVSFVDSASDKTKLHSDCILYEKDFIRLAQLLSLSQKAYRRINQSIYFSNAYNLVFGAAAFARRFDTFAAKSFNTLNSLWVLLLNQRINHLRPARVTAEKTAAATPDSADGTIPLLE